MLLFVVKIMWNIRNNSLQIKTDYEEVTCAALNIFFFFFAIHAVEYNEWEFVLFVFAVGSCASKVYLMMPAKSFGTFSQEKFHDWLYPEGQSFVQKNIGTNSVDIFQNIGINVYNFFECILDVRRRVRWDEVLDG